MSSKKQTSSAGDALMLVAGSTSSQILSIIAAPILTRMYSPEAFGIMAIYVSIIGILGVVVCLRYEIAIMLPEEDEVALNLLGLSLMLSALVSGLTIPLIWLWQRPLLKLLNATMMGVYIWFVPVALFFGAVNQSLNYWNSRKKDFAQVSVTRVLSSSITNFSQLGCGFLGFTSAGALMSGGLTGMVTATVGLAAHFWRNSGRLLRNSICWKGMMCSAKHYRNIPLYSIWATVLNTLSWQLPTFMFARYFSVEVVGLYSLGFRALSIPMDMIAGSIGQVFFQRTAAAKVNGKLAELVEGAVQRLIVFAVFPILLLMLVGPDLFASVFGQKWTEAGVYARILCPWIAVWFISSPISTLINVLDLQRFGLIINIVIFTSRLASLYLGVLFNNVHISLIAFSASGILVYGYLCIALLNAAGARLLIVSRTFISNSLLVIPCGVLLSFLRYIDASRTLIITAACIILLAYFVRIISSDASIASLVALKFPFMAKYIRFKYFER